MLYVNEMESIFNKLKQGLPMFGMERNAINLKVTNLDRKSVV